MSVLVGQCPFWLSIIRIQNILCNLFLLDGIYFLFPMNWNMKLTLTTEIGVLLDVNSLWSFVERLILLIMSALLFGLWLWAWTQNTLLQNRFLLIIIFICTYHLLFDIKRPNLWSWFNNRFPRLEHADGLPEEVVALLSIFSYLKHSRLFHYLRRFVCVLGLEFIQLFLILLFRLWLVLKTLAWRVEW